MLTNIIPGETKTTRTPQLRLGNNKGLLIFSKAITVTRWINFNVLQNISYFNTCRYTRLYLLQEIGRCLRN